MCIYISTKVILSTAQSHCLPSHQKGVLQVNEYVNNKVCFVSEFIAQYYYNQITFVLLEKSSPGKEGKSPKQRLTAKESSKLCNATTRNTHAQWASKSDVAGPAVHAHVIPDRDRHIHTYARTS